MLFVSRHRICGANMDVRLLLLCLKIGRVLQHASTIDAVFVYEMPAQQRQQMHSERVKRCTNHQSRHE